MSTPSTEVGITAQQMYARAVRQANWRKFFHTVTHQCNDLMPASDVLSHLDLDQRKNLGVQQVPVDQITGSIGRYRDFDLAFSPRHPGTENRWINVAQVSQRGAALPPVLLYKVGEAFFVVDGNHRISIARAAGRRWISAQVIEIDPSPLIPEPSCQRLGFKIPDRAPQCSR